ncbi:hypothetical protein K440DRAFT_303153 [Wilcoxina mikolae CBS 423.85]|nr:hypothetical protein K440DRAFT_303153 [Wilcoxina mikolae CBS 423.85]
MNFDFSYISTSGNIDGAVTNLRDYISGSLLEFIAQYAHYFEDGLSSTKSSFVADPAQNFVKLVRDINLQLERIQTADNAAGKRSDPLLNVEGIYLLADEYDSLANNYMNPTDPLSWSGTEVASNLKSFWSAVKHCMGVNHNRGLKKTFITGVTPLLLTQYSSGFNIAQNISFDPGFSTMCGITKSDVLAALKLVCDDQEKVDQCLRELTFYTNGYHFCGETTVPTVFNTETVIWYLKAILTGREKPNFANPSNLEVSEPFLDMCSGSPEAVGAMQFALQKEKDGNYNKISYNSILDNFKLEELCTQATGKGKGGVPAYQSLLVYMGGVTFDSKNPSTFLRIPNRVVATRFGMALLNRHELYWSMSQAVRFLSSTGDLRRVLSGYLRLMKQCDVARGESKMTEQFHRDSFWVTILDNPAISATVEYHVSKQSEDAGFVDLLIESKNLYTVVEFKNIELPFLNLWTSRNKQKTQDLINMSLADILHLQFHKREGFGQALFRSGWTGMSAINCDRMSWVKRCNPTAWERSFVLLQWSLLGHVRCSFAKWTARASGKAIGISSRGQTLTTGV